ncbi:Uncharacterized protein dnm_075470 [Desulfonema magnum]|uniref:Uncharacterized protein n=1 Tax=Desulfonema magnum TaxID=45655 RepID=A0A975BUI1_9BACT|nr:Uncharacterized protein dnm_075470 [Desulfonema magnum]
MHAGFAVSFFNPTCRVHHGPSFSLFSAPKTSRVNSNIPAVRKPDQCSENKKTLLFSLINFIITKFLIFCKIIVYKFFC